MRKKIEIYSEILYYGLLNIRSSTYCHKRIWPWSFKKARQVIKDCNMLSDFMHNIPKRMTYENYDKEDIYFITWFPKMIFNDNGECKYYGIGPKTIELYNAFPLEMKSQIEWVPSSKILKHNSEIL